MLSKKILSIIILSCLLFTACGDDSSPNSNETKALYTVEEFKLSFPNDWEVIEKESFPSNVPSETLVVFRDNIKNEIFTTNINISKINTKEAISPQDFAKSTLAKAKNTLVGYKKISLEQIEVSYKDKDTEAYISDYEGKKSPSDNPVHFKELYITIDKSAYIISAAYLPSTDESTIKEIEESLQSFTIN